MLRILIAITVFSSLHTVEQYLSVVCTNSPTSVGTSTKSYYPFGLLETKKKLYCCAEEPFKSNRNYPVVYCFEGVGKRLENIFMSAEVVIDLKPDQYDLYTGKDYNEIMEQFTTHQSVLRLNFLFWRPTEIRLNPFNGTCIGIKTDDNYSLELMIEKSNFLRQLMFFGGLLIFYVAPILAEEPIFYYIVGISTGILASVLVIFYFIIKFLPLKRPAMLGMMVGGGTFAVYMFETIISTVWDLMTFYQWYVTVYILVSGVISFIVCYRFGPVTNPRSKNLIKWGLQAAALALILNCSHLQEATLIISFTITFFYYIPIIQLTVRKSLQVYRWFSYGAVRPPPLLTEEEYTQQGVRETRRGLEELRRYCNSPQFQASNQLSRLRDSRRFRRFLIGKELDISLEEENLYEREIFGRHTEAELTDDSDD